MKHEGILGFDFLNENYNNGLSCFFRSHCRLVLSFTKAHSICRSLGEKRGTYFVNLISSNLDSNIIAFSVLTSGRDFSVLDHCELTISGLFSFENGFSTCYWYTD